MHIWGHFRTITQHKILVTSYCFRIGLFRQGLAHDLSKYAPCEFWKGCRYWQGNRSPNNAEREETGVSLAWLHHKGRNKHHFEYWIDYDLSSDTLITGMPIPKKYVAEMICDRIAASRTYEGKAYTDRSALNYYMNGYEKFWFVHEDCREQLKFLLEMLAEKGEEETFRFIRNVFLKRPWQEVQKEYGKNE
ncbi:MAG: DUF5662 family protein [Lachnospiraceae bacterium]|nr:DUF5662 family protein [Lachnospiraceae bacterium]